MQNKDLRNGIIAAVAIAAVAFGNHPAGADDVAAAGRQIAAKNENAIIKVQIVSQTKMSMEGRETTKRESKTESTATIIDPSGLAVVSLSAANPTEMLT